MSYTCAGCGEQFENAEDGVQYRTSEETLYFHRPHPLSNTADRTNLITGDTQLGHHTACHAAYAGRMIKQGKIVNMFLEPITELDDIAQE